MLTDPGDALLYAMSARKDLSWSVFRSTFDALYGRFQPVEGSIRFVRWRAATLMDALGHCDLRFSDHEARVVVAPAVLALLPRPGLPQAVLCGARAPQMVQRLVAACGAHPRLRGVVQHQSTAQGFAPTRVLFEAESNADFQELAEVVGIGFEAVPPAWALTHAASSIGEYLSSADWTSAAELNWSRQDFDPDALAFGSSRDSSSETRLTSYEDPVRRTATDRLWIDGRSAVVDRSWGRYAALAAASIRVLEYDPATCTAGVPVRAPLPRIIARALTLCSGSATEVGPAHAGQSFAGSNRSYYLYADVPADIFQVAAAKLGQEHGYPAGMQEGTRV